jgi:hypothetical protein
VIPFCLKQKRLSLIRKPFFVLKIFYYLLQMQRH